MTESKLRILFLIPGFSKGGAERFLVDLCTELALYDDIEFVIGVLSGCNQYSDLTAGFNIVSLDYQTPSIFGKNENRAYKELLDTFQPHIIHTNLFLAEFLSSYYADNRIKYVCHGHDNMHQFRNFDFKTLCSKVKLLEYYEKQHLIRKKYRYCDTYFIANSTHTGAFYKNTLPGRMKENVKLIQYGFNYNRFYDSGNKTRDEKSPFKILNVGSFQDKKNQIFIIEIAHELKKRGIGFEINLLGAGANFEKVQNAAIENGLGQNVILRGIIDNVEDWYKASDLYLHTAWYEPFGLVFLEAMASGLPVVTLDGKGNRDIIETGKNGYLFYEQDAGQFADAIVDLHENREQYAAISAYAREYAARFDVKYKVKELVDFYYSIM